MQLDEVFVSLDKMRSGRSAGATFWTTTIEKANCRRFVDQPQGEQLQLTASRPSIRLPVARFQLARRAFLTLVTKTDH